MLAAWFRAEAALASRYRIVEKLGGGGMGGDKGLGLRHCAAILGGDPRQVNESRISEGRNPIWAAP